MSDIQRILVAVDFSEGSKAALEYAAFVAARASARLDLLHVWHAPEVVPVGETSGDGSVASLVRASEAQAGTDLHEFASKARERGIEIERSFTEAGVPSSTIAAVASQQKHDLIAMGTHGRTGIAHALLGSVAERVVRCAPCPVLTVRDSTPVARPVITRVMAPVDYSSSSRETLAYAASVATLLGAELDVVHVWEQPVHVPEDVMVHAPDVTQRSLGDLMQENAEHRMSDFLTSFSSARGETTSPPLGHRVLSGATGTTLIAELESGTYELVVLGTHGRTGLKHLLLGSIAEKLVRHSRVPVITVPPVQSRQ